VPSGIEITPPRAERSSGPGHRDFAILSGPDISIADDMARRDFTVNAIARRLSDGALIDPFDGVADLERRELRTVSPKSFSEDPLRILRGLRLVSQLGFTLPAETLEQMRRDVPGLAHVSAERIGGGIAADGLGELSKLLLGREPARALRLARDTGVLELIVPEFAAAVGHQPGSARQPQTLDEHIFAVVQNASNEGASLEVLLATLFHDLGKPAVERDHARAGAEIAGSTLARLRYPTVLRKEVVAIVRDHAYDLEPWRGSDQAALATRRFLAAHGARRAGQLVSHKRADLSAKVVPEWELEAFERLAVELVVARDQPHRLSDLEVNGNELIAIGFTPGPQLGQVLGYLLARVVDEPALNEREQLLALARTELG
jgi:tRNA nucleotidyltransferase (CCA-adding enzyme)